MLVTLFLVVVVSFVLAMLAVLIALVSRMGPSLATSGQRQQQHRDQRLRNAHGFSPRLWECW
jgi:hypothetical protein